MYVLIYKYEDDLDKYLLEDMATLSDTIFDSDESLKLFKLCCRDNFGGVVEKEMHVEANERDNWRITCTPHKDVMKLGHINTCIYCKQNWVFFI